MWPRRPAERAFRPDARRFRPCSKPLHDLHVSTVDIHKPDAADRGPDSEVPAHSGHHPRGTAHPQQTQDPLPAGAHHRRRGDWPPRTEPRAARQQHHPLRHGRPALHHVPLGARHGHVRLQAQQLAQPRLRTLHLLRAARAGYPRRPLPAGLPSLLVDPAGRALRLADAHRLPHRQQARHRPRQVRHDLRGRHGHHRHAGPAAAHDHRGHGHGQRRRPLLVAAHALGRALHRRHRGALPAARALVLQARQRQHLAIYLRAGAGLPGRLPTLRSWQASSPSSAPSSRVWPSTASSRARRP